MTSQNDKDRRESGADENARHDRRPDEDKNRQDGGPRQIDDNQDDLGRDVNDPGQISNDINKKAGA